jgi:hypothetical protein
MFNELKIHKFYASASTVMVRLEIGIDSEAYALIFYRFLLHSDATTSLSSVRIR